MMFIAGPSLSYWCAVLISLLITINSSAAQSSSAQETPKLVFQPYELQTQGHGNIAAEVAYLRVPQRHSLDGTGAESEANRRQFKLRVVRLKALAPSGQAPVVYLAGGPGGSGVAAARGPRWPIFNQVRQHVDVLLLDQRGTGDSEPPPVCSHRLEPNWTQGSQAGELQQRIQGMLRACIAEWQSQGVDLAAYTSVQSAADLADLRRALGVAHLQLWGMSYGTHLAMATLRAYPEQFVRAVLMGAEGPDHTLKLPLAADHTLLQIGHAARSRFPNFLKDIQTTLANLRQQEGVATSWTLGFSEVRISAFDAQLAIALCLGRGDTQAMLPLAMQEAARGNYGLLSELVVATRRSLQEWRAMPLVMDYASGASAARRQLINEQKSQSLLGDALNFPFTEISAMGLPLPDLGDGFRAPLSLSHPILLISGTRDGRTPVANAQDLMTLWPQAAHLVLEGAAHDDDLWLSHPEIGPLLASFFQGTAVSSQTLPAQTIAFAQSDFAVLQMFGLKYWHLTMAVLLLLLATYLGYRLVKLVVRWRHARIA